MPAIILPGKWLRQPQGSLSVDWSNDLARGLELLFIPSLGSVNLANVSPGSGLWTRSARQDGLTGIGDTSNSFSFDSGSVDASKPVSVFTRGTILNIDSRRVCGTSAVSFQHGGAPGATLQATYLGVSDYNATATVDLYNGAYGSAFYSTGCTITPATTGGLIFYGKGAQVGAAVNTGTPASGANKIYLFAQNTSNRTDNYAASIIAVWNRALSATEHASLDANPWQLIRKRGRIYFLPSAGGGGATLTADSGTYTLTGTAATLKADRKLAAGSGSYAVTGTDAALKVGRKLSADSGTYSVTGTAVNFLRGYALAAESGSYSVSGTDAALRVGRLLSAASGSYVLSGSAAALQYQPAGSYSLTAESGAYTLTGTAATLKVSRKLTAESGSYSLTGSDATFKRGFSVSAGAGSYTLTGTNVAFARTYVLGAETGAYTLTGSDVGLTWSAAPVVETPTHGGPSIYGKAVFREKEFRREYDEQIRRIDEAKLAERLIREDEELIIIMAALAA